MLPPLILLVAGLSPNVWNECFWSAPQQPPPIPHQQTDSQRLLIFMLLVLHYSQILTSWINLRYFSAICGYRSVELLQLLLSLNCFFSLFLTHIFILTQISSSLNWMFIQMVYSELNTWQNIFSDNKWSQVNLRNIFNKTYRIFIVYDLTEKFAFWLHTILQVTRKTTWHIHSFLTNYVEHTHPKTAKPITELVTRTRYIHCPCQQHLPPTAQNVR